MYFTHGRLKIQNGQNKQKWAETVGRAMSKMDKNRENQQKRVKNLLTENALHLELFCI